MTKTQAIAAAIELLRQEAEQIRKTNSVDGAFGFAPEFERMLHDHIVEVIAALEQP